MPYAVTVFWESRPNGHEAARDGHRARSIVEPRRAPASGSAARTPGPARTVKTQAAQDRPGPNHHESPMRRPSMTANTTTRRFYVCAPDAGCSNYSDTLHFFEEWGIEPAPGHDAGGHYFAISVPEDWPEERASEFEAALAARTRKLTFEEQASAFAG